MTVINCKYRLIHRFKTTTHRIVRANPPNNL